MTPLVLYNGNSDCSPSGLNSGEFRDGTTKDTVFILDKFVGRWISKVGR